MAVGVATTALLAGVWETELWMVEWMRLGIEPVCVVAAFLQLMCLMHSFPSKPEAVRVRGWAEVVIAIGCAAFMVSPFSQAGDTWDWAAIGIALMVLGAIPATAFLVMGSIIGRGGIVDEQTRRLMVSIECPKCLLLQDLPTSGAACANCGLRIDITVKGSECPKCGYSLVELKRGVCPECGTVVTTEGEAGPSKAAGE